MECKLERKTQPTATHPVPHHTATGQLASGTNELCRWLKPLRKAILQGMLTTLPLGDSESNPRARGNRIHCNRLGQKRYRSKILQQICLENQLSSRMPGSQALRPCQGLPHMGWPTRAPVRSPTPVRIYPQFSLPGRVRPTGMYEVCQYTRMRAGNYVTNALSNMSALDELAASAPPTTPATEVSSTLAFRLAGRPPAPAGCLATRMHQRSMQHLQSEHTTDSTLRPSLATSFRKSKWDSQEDGLQARTKQNRTNCHPPPTLCPITQQLANCHLGQTSYVLFICRQTADGGELLVDGSQVGKPSSIWEAWAAPMDEEQQNRRCTDPNDLVFGSAQDCRQGWGSSITPNRILISTTHDIRAPPSSGSDGCVSDGIPKTPRNGGSPPCINNNKWLLAPTPRTSSCPRARRVRRRRCPSTANVATNATNVERSCRYIC